LTIRDSAVPPARANEVQSVTSRWPISTEAISVWENTAAWSTAATSAAPPGRDHRGPHRCRATPRRAEPTGRGNWWRGGCRECAGHVRCGGQVSCASRPLAASRPRRSTIGN